MTTYRLKQLGHVFVLPFLAGTALAEEGSGTPNGVWLDESRDYVVHHADNIAVWMDNFFGVSRVEEEAPYSTLRLRIEQEWEEIDGWDSGLSLRGKVHLPGLNQRLALLFSDEDERTGSDDLLIDRQDSPDDVALQYTARERNNHRLDFKLGLRSSLHPKVSARYRYEHPFQQDLIGRFSEEVIYRTDDGFASQTRVELDKILSDDRVIQWYNRLNWEEDEPGVSWRTGFALNRRLSDKRALSYFVSAGGETKPSHYTSSYGLGVRYRQRVYRQWLYAEIQPAYHWRRPHYEDSRRGSASILLRLDAVFTREAD